MYKKNDDLFADITETQTILIDMENGVFYLLSVFTNLVFKFLISGKDISEIKEIFGKLPGIPNDYEKRIDEVVKQLLELNLIVECDTIDNSMVAPDFTPIVIQGMQEEDFAYIIEPSDDLQNLLLDDPIHDVSIDGWTPIEK